MNREAAITLRNEIASIKQDAFDLIWSSRYARLSDHGYTSIEELAWDTIKRAGDRIEKKIQAYERAYHDEH